MENQFSRSISHRHVWLTLLVWLKWCLPFCPLKPHHWVIHWVMTSKQTFILSSPSKGDKYFSLGNDRIWSNLGKRKIIDSKVPFVWGYVSSQVGTWIEIITKTKTGSSVLASAEYLQLVRLEGRRRSGWSISEKISHKWGSVKLPTLVFSTSYHYLY